VNCAPPDAILLAPQDNVATALRAIAAGELVRARCGGRVVAVEAAELVPFCHKISLARIGAGESVVKYGEPIGLALEAVGPGRHVHVHNMRSARGRGPAAGGAPR
jgi:altronate dehydratase small subunit